jgi:DNA-binding winged helix-turn-helix (wHTH) protein/Flp pilus assembly protein TadD
MEMPFMDRTYEFGEFRLDASKRMLIRGGDEVHVSPKAIELLVLLVESGDRVVTRAEIMDRLWQDTFVEEGNINFHISNLRRALGQNGKPESQYIRTVPRKGYKFIAELKQPSNAVADVPEQSPRTEPPPRRWQPLLFAGAITVAFGVVFAAVFGFGVRKERSGFNSDTPQLSADAVAAYKQGKMVWESRVFTEQDPGELFRQAIAIEPAYLDAHIALADTYAFDATPEKAEQAIAKARSIGGDSAELLATEAFIRMFHYWDWQAAESGFVNAIALDPANAKARHWYGVLLSLTGRLDEARSEMRRARELSPDSLIIASDLGQLEYFAGDLSAAESELMNVLRLEPRFTMARRYLAEVHEARGNEAEAFEERQKSVVRPSADIAESKKVFEQGGLRHLWERTISNGKCNADSAIPYDCARLYAKLGDEEKALDQLELAIRKRAFHAPFALVDPVFGPLRESDRFQAASQALVQGSSFARK